MEFYDALRWTNRKNVGTRIYEHQLAVRRHDQFHLVLNHQDKMGHLLDLKDVSKLVRVNSNITREFIVVL